MSKITVRADDDLVAELEAMDASKSQVVREALRAYLDGGGGEGALTDGEGIQDADGGTVDTAAEDTLDALVRERVDDVVRERVDAVLSERGVGVRPSPQDVNVTVAVEGAASDATASSSEAVGQSDGEADANADAAASSDCQTESSCAQCGESLAGEHVYCPNCGEKASRRAFCECGDEVRSDWAFCPGCGRRTPAADVLDSG
jgi:predicted transcriptional regulator